MEREITQWVHHEGLILQAMSRHSTVELHLASMFSMSLNKTFLYKGFLLLNRKSSPCVGSGFSLLLAES